MKIYFKNKKMPAMLVTLLMLGIGNGEASTSFNSQATLGFTINSISNANDPGDLSGLTMQGSFEQAPSPTAYIATTGDGSVIANNSSVDSMPMAIGSPFVSTFSVSGNVSNGTVESSNAGWYTLAFNNSSTTDDYVVNLTLAYNILANITGQYANSDIMLDVYSDNNPMLGNIFIDANSINPQNAVANSSFPLYTFNIAHGSSLAVYADVTINSSLQASAVPLPAVAWTFLTGLLGILGLNKRRTNSSE